MDRELLMAWAVATWKTALDHLHALRSAGVDVSDLVLSRVEGELQSLAETFMRERGADDYDKFQLPVAVYEARQICTNNQGRLDELLSRAKE